MILFYVERNPSEHEKAESGSLEALSRFQKPSTHADTSGMEGDRVETEREGQLGAIFLPHQERTLDTKQIQGLTDDSVGIVAAREAGASEFKSPGPP